MPRNSAAGRLTSLPQLGRERMLVGELAAREPLLHRERVQLVLVDGVDVIEVVLDAAGARRPLGHQRRQDAELVHDLERRRLRARRERRRAPRAAAGAASGSCASGTRIARDRLGGELARVAVDRQLLGDRDAEQPHHLARPLGEQARVFDRELAVERDEAGVDLRNARLAARGTRADSSSRSAT